MNIFIGTRGRIILFYLFPLIFSVILLCSSCSKDKSNPDEVPEFPAQKVYEINTPEMGSMFTCENKLGAGGQDGFLYIWQWDNLDMRPNKVKLDSWYPLSYSKYEFTKGEIYLHDNKFCALLTDERIVYASHQKGDTFIIIKNSSDGRELKRYPIGIQWQCAQLVNTVNGKFVALYFRQDYKVNYDEISDDIGIISVPSNELKWLNKLTLSKGYDHLVMSGVSVSEDGKYIAAVGANNGGWIQLTDVEKERVLWEKVPYGIWSVNFNDACFSPDSNNVYVAGNTGLFCFEVLTGKILSQWQTDGRLISIVASPDGRLVAAGTTASGDVYVYETRTGKLLQLIKTGQYTVLGLAFSPDSKLLATEGVLNTNIKIWKMPDKNQQTK